MPIGRRACKTREKAHLIKNAKYSDEKRQQALEALLLNPDMSPSELQAKYLDEHGV